jgi:hypothetical protein
VFLLTRRGEHLQLCGRSPIEELTAIEGVSKENQTLLRDARLARNSGQPLAGIALMRCFLEQYARKLANSTEQGDRLMEAYQGSLPDSFPSRFRTFVSLYKKLSGALHVADDSNETFDGSLEAIVDHFRARMLYRVK